MAGAAAKALYAGLTCAVAGLVLALIPAGAALESAYGLNWLFKLRGIERPPDDVVVVAIDKTSADALGLPNRPDQWPRALHAQLIDALRERGASVVAFDIHFREPRDSAMDQALANAIKRAGNVVLLERVVSEHQPVTDAGVPGTSTLTVEQRISPLAIFSDAALATAPFPLPKVPMQVQQAWLFKSAAGDTPTLPMVAFQIHARREYERLHTAVLAINPAAAGRLAPSVQRVGGSTQLANRMIDLRNLLQHDIALAAQLKAVATAEHDTALMRALLHSYVAGEETRYINFYGPPRTIRTVGFHELLNAPAGTMDLRRKAVFVGFADDRLQEQRDAFHTVFSRDDGVDLSGVEIAATIFGNLVSDRFIAPLDNLAQIALITVWGIGIALVAYVLPTITGYVVVGVLGAGYLYVALILFGAEQRWLPLAIPLLIQTPLALGITTLSRLRETQRQRQAITRAFSHYLPREAVEQLTRSRNGVQRGGAEMYGICLCTDAERYTTLSETLSPRALAALMNDYYETVFAPIRRHGGVLSDIVGDAMLALWAVPEDARDARLRACLAAIAIQRDVERFNQRHHAHALPTRIGVHCGPIVLGNVGALDHFEYRAVGDAVNTSNRLQALNKMLGTRVLVSGNVIAGLDDISARHLGSFRLRGKSQPLEIYDICPPADARMAARLMESFAAALACFQQRQWDDARRAFSALLMQFPDDGPARYYMALCETYRQDPPVEEWSGVIEAGQY